MNRDEQLLHHLLNARGGACLLDNRPDWSYLTRTMNIDTGEIKRLTDEQLARRMRQGERLVPVTAAQAQTLELLSTSERIEWARNHMPGLFRKRGQA